MSFPVNFWKSSIDSMKYTNIEQFTKILFKLNPSSGDRIFMPFLATWGRKIPQGIKRNKLCWQISHDSEMSSRSTIKDTLFGAKKFKMKYSPLRHKNYYYYTK